MGDFNKEAERVKGHIASAADVLETKPKNIINFLGVLAGIAVVAVVVYLIIR